MSSWRQANPDGAIFTDHTRRRDGERPLSIAAGFVVLLTIGLDVNASAHGHDWRALAFYTGFCLLAMAACIVLALQWRNERVYLCHSHMVHFDWLDRRTDVDWKDLPSAVEKRWPVNERLVLEYLPGRHLVIHNDFQDYGDVVSHCRKRIESAGGYLQVDMPNLSPSLSDDEGSSISQPLASDLSHLPESLPR